MLYTRYLVTILSAHDVWHRQTKDLKAGSKIPLRYVEDVDTSLEDVVLEGKQFVAKCYGQNQLSSSENRYREWKDKPVDHSVQKFWISASIDTSPLLLYDHPPVLIFFPNPSLSVRIFQQFSPMKYSIDTKINSRGKVKKSKSQNKHPKWKTF